MLLKASEQCGETSSTCFEESYLASWPCPAREIDALLTRRGRLPELQVEQLDGESSVLHRALKGILFLEEIYTFNNRNEVKRFLSTHDYVIDSLFEASLHIGQVFGYNIVEQSLEYNRDPEEEYEGLSVIIKTNLSPSESLDLLDKFDKDWWLDVDVQVRKVLIVMVRPV